VIYNCNTPFDPYSGKSNTVSLESGAVAKTSGGLQFTINKAATVPASPCNSNGVNSHGVSVTATAYSIGEQYNIPGDTSVEISGLSGAADGAFTGGSKETVKVIQQSDLDTAGDNLKKKAQDEADKVKADLTTQMGGSVTILQDSFAINYGNLNSKPTLDETVGEGGATATMEITYVLLGLSDNDLKSLIAKQVESVTEDDQKIYDNGVSKIQFKNFAVDGQNYSVVIKTTAKIGPKIDEEQIKERVVGKRAGQIMSDLESIDGVNNVDVKFSPFWVSAAPSADRLKVEFTVED
jgi:hypothetical protein